MKHAVETDAVKIGLKAQGDVDALDVLARGILVDGERGKEERMQEGNTGEVPLHGLGSLSIGNNADEEVEAVAYAYFLSNVGYFDYCLFHHSFYNLWCKDTELFRICNNNGKNNLLEGDFTSSKSLTGGLSPYEALVPQINIL